MHKVIAVVALLGITVLGMTLLTPAQRPPYDPYQAQRAALTYQAQVDTATRAQGRADALEPFLRLLLMALAVAPVAGLVVALDAWRLRRRLVVVDALGRLPMPRRIIETDARPALAALGAFHASEYQRASPRLAGRDVAPAPALLPPPPPGDAPPPPPLDLMHALQTFTPTPTKLLMGQGTNGPIYRSLEQLLHVGILGSSGSGKSTSQLSLAVQLAMIPNALMAILDPEAATFQALQRSSRLFVPFPNDGAACIRNLHALQTELDGRRALLSEGGAWDWLEYNRDMGGNMRPLFAFVDELPSLTGYADTEPRLLDLARRGRKCGMYLVVASQSLKKDDVGSTTIRQQFATKLLLRIGETAQGRALGFDTQWTKAAVQFSEPGLAVYAPNDGPPEIIRVPYISRATAAQALTQADSVAFPRAETSADVEIVGPGFSSHAEIVSSASAGDISAFPASPVDVVKAARIAFLRSAEGGNKRKMEIISELWGVTSGRRYVAASAAYDAALAQLQRLGRC